MWVGGCGEVGVVGVGCGSECAEVGVGVGR